MDKTCAIYNCNVPCYNGKHFINFEDGKAVIPTWEFFNIVRHWEENIKNICGIICTKKEICNPHKKIRKFTFF